MKVLIIDNYDSFTHNLAYLIRQVTGTLPVIKRNDCITIEEVDAYDKILLSPGPGIPSEAGSLLPIIRHYASYKSILGVCLGHQAIGEAFGGTLANMDTVFHGVESPIKIIEPGHLLAGISNPFMAGHYHSWTLQTENLPGALKVLATDGMGNIMAIQHREYNVYGVQFHPESIMTPAGKQIITNWINLPS